MGAQCTTENTGKCCNANMCDLQQKTVSRPYTPMYVQGSENVLDAIPEDLPSMGFGDRYEKSGPGEHEEGPQQNEREEEPQQSHQSPESCKLEPWQQSSAEPIDDRPDIFTIDLNKTPMSKLGVSVDQMHDGGKSLLVSLITEGIVDDWNMENPKRALRPGDKIIGVDGQCGDANELVLACQKVGMLELMIERGELIAAEDSNQ
mmetsp:Transcript_103604/g.161512  ORF Transcript_103604/g.161512 Transcript_103604/m.161512 type:complete len:204 (+) Transcript_103604:142-753(+)|eukprot:CAMPEP_0169386888 /NCGR_PEP_ID=MMETSP1017-20121227/45040_1 /TAXON_ID=342587 /ORGANISM="Karlodinium micrum, Strain CCMP2283" /LENGTH=203 /DNA_ID=CAMNT_0009488221 /DNA_START=133 /DNA_END=744 /DNA_ORIENTATION=+